MPQTSGSTPAPSLSFGFLVNSNTINSPGNLSGAVGTNLFAVSESTIKGQGFLGTNAPNYNIGTSNWWSNIFHFSGVWVNYPKVVWDPHCRRWITSASGRGDSYYLLLAVSKSESSDTNPTNWYANMINVNGTSGDRTKWPEISNIGFNKNWIVAQLNMFYSNNNAFSHSQIYVVPKTNYYAGFFAHTSIPLTNHGASQIPACSYDTNSDVLYLVQNFNGNWNQRGNLRLFCITNTAPPSLLETTQFVSTVPTWANIPTNANFGPQTNGIKFQLGNARIQNVVFKNGFLWCAQTIFYPSSNPTRSAIQWWKITTNGVPVQVGQIDDSSGCNFYAFPSIAINSVGDALIGYSLFSSNTYASAGYALRCNGSDRFAPGALLKAGESTYYLNHGAWGYNVWGAYSSTVLGANDLDFWTLQPYAASGTSNWAGWWGQIALTPTNDSFLSPRILSGPQGTITNGPVLRATKEPEEPNHAGTAAGSSIWYAWTAATNGTVVFETAGSSFDTVLGVYNGSTIGGLSLVASNDNHNGTASLVSFTATSGTTYRIAVDRATGSAFGNDTAVLNWYCAAAPVIIRQPTPLWNVISGSNITFSAEVVGTPAPSFQWRYNGTDIPGATASCYTRNNVQTNDTGDYVLVATNLFGVAESTVSHLQVYGSAVPLMSTPDFTNSGQFYMTVSGVTNSTYIVEASSNLIDWNSVWTGVVTFVFTDQNTTTNAYQFYRARYKP